MPNADKEAMSAHSAEIGQRIGWRGSILVLDKAGRHSSGELIVWRTIRC